MHEHPSRCQTHATGSLSDLCTVPCRVAGGLDSLVMGEGQILAQVKQVHNVGQNCAGFGRHLNSLFRQAITAGECSHQLCPSGAQTLLQHTFHAPLLWLLLFLWPAQLHQAMQLLLSV